MAKAKEQKRKATTKDYQVLLAPVITEKSSIVGGAGNRVVFRVDPRSSKPEIKKAVEAVFNVDVTRVNTARYMGKLKRVTRDVGRQKGYKKAIVTLKEGQSIDLIEGL
ncbi:MAG: 50S ribosomal protein L23 [Bdellovibrionales bacterium]|nr:50S ribosomal protein L23 [Bdellovibrionales bacterium]